MQTDNNITASQQHDFYLSHVARLVRDKAHSMQHGEISIIIKTLQKHGEVFQFYGIQDIMVYHRKT